MANKRPLTPPSSSSSLDTPTPKAARTSLPSTTNPSLFCTLPPTCHPPSNRPTPLKDARELEAHYAKYHAHVCEVFGCMSVFPDARMLDLHFTECHDSLAAVRKERGEKIFACFQTTCARKFSTPKTRRLHLIQAHGYPKQYFFAITNKGVGGLLKRWGEGASLVRGDWNAREGNKSRGADSDDSDEGEDNEDEGDEMAQDKLTENGPAGAMGSVSRSVKAQKDEKNLASGAVTNGSVRSNEKGKEKIQGTTIDADLDSLEGSMSSLSLVPSSIRFGRGSKSAVLGRGRGRGAPGAGSQRYIIDESIHGADANGETRSDETQTVENHRYQQTETPRDLKSNDQRPPSNERGKGGHAARGRGGVPRGARRGGFGHPPPRGGWMGARAFMPPGYGGGRGTGRGRGADD